MENLQNDAYIPTMARVIQIWRELLHEYASFCILKNNSKVNSVIIKRADVS
jgi:hypothetical protein